MAGSVDRRHDRQAGDDLNPAPLQEWARAAIEAASRWCPDASSIAKDRAADSLALELAQSRGFGRCMNQPEVKGFPIGGERELLESAEELSRTGQIPSPRSILEVLAVDAPHLDPVHPLGFAIGPKSRSCGDCAWNSNARCLQTFRHGRAGKPIDKNWPACIRWETRLTDDSCGTCGACCREGYSLAPVKRGEPMAKAHPEWVVDSIQGRCLPRPNGRCVALDGEGTQSAPWRCRDYASRMRACSELVTGGKACLVARRRLGLSR